MKHDPPLYCSIQNFTFAGWISSIFLSQYLVIYWSILYFSLFQPELLSISIVTFQDSHHKLIQWILVIMNLDIMISLIITIVYVMLPQWRPQLKSLVITISLIITMGKVLSEPYHNYKISMYLTNDCNEIHLNSLPKICYMRTGSKFPLD